jgi:dipeptidase
VSCDSFVAFPPFVRGRRPMFAKNSDRPDDECQPLVQAAAADHAAGAKLACTYIEIDQVRHTNAFLGSRPNWLWGCEHGVNEHGVAIGNHTIYTRDPVAKTGLLGMDLVRLGLERAASASEAVEAIVGLIERYGQGGSGFETMDWPYHNSFLLADAKEGFVLETSDRNWAVRRFVDRASASNHTTIGSDWDRLSERCEAHARERGWWTHEGERFDFAVAYRDAETIPPYVSSGRFRTTCDALSEAGEPLDLAAAKAVLRDHYGDGQLYRPGVDPSTEECFSVCMHAGAIGQTTASMIAELGASEDAAQLCWVAFGNPCMSVYLPVFPEAPLPAALTSASSDPAACGAWHRFKALGDRIAADPAAYAELAHAHWATYERQLEGVAAEIGEVMAMGELEYGEEDRIELLETFMQEAWEATLEEIDKLHRLLDEAGAAAPVRG